MDPSRKRAIRLTVALTAALLLASALVYTSFAAGRDEVTASQLAHKAKPGQVLHPGGHGARRLGPPPGLDAAVPRARPEAQVSVPVRYTGIVPDPFAAGRGVLVDGQGAGPSRLDLRRRAELAHDQVPLEVPGGEPLLLMAVASLRWR